MIAGDVDAVVMDDVAGQGYVGVNAEALTLLDGSLISEELGFTLSLLWWSPDPTWSSSMRAIPVWIVSS